MAISKQAPITIEVGLDENKIPETIQWSAPDGGIKKAAAKAMLLSLWDAEQQESLRMDLWVKDMPVDQMQRFFIRVWSPWAKPTCGQPRTKKWHKGFRILLHFLQKNSSYTKPFNEIEFLLELSLYLKPDR